MHRGCTAGRPDHLLFSERVPPHDAGARRADHGRWHHRGGTSQASPHVAGAVAELRAAFPADTLATTQGRLTTSSAQTTDARNGVTRPRLALAEAAWPPNDDFAAGLGARAAQAACPAPTCSPRAKSASRCIPRRRPRVRCGGDERHRPPGRSGCRPRAATSTRCWRSTPAARSRCWRR